MAAVAAVRAAVSAIEAAARATEERLADGGRLIYVGAGTSGRLAVQDGAELVPTFNWPEDRVLLLIAGGKDALLRAVENAEDDVPQAARLGKQHEIAPSDVVIAVAASGTTPFTLACLREAKRRGALTIGVANNRDTPVLQEADCPIWLDTGPEPIAGSTRMKAGTAQRVALNLLSSLVMIRLGRVHQGLMVDVRATNAKLARRSENILRQLNGSQRRRSRRCAPPGRWKRETRGSVAAGLHPRRSRARARPRAWQASYRAAEHRPSRCRGGCSRARRPDRCRRTAVGYEG